MPVAAPGATRAASARLRGIAAPPPPTAATKRARPPTADSSTLASSPLPRPTGGATVVSGSPQRSPTKRSRTNVEVPIAPATPTNRNTAPTTLETPIRNANTRAVPPINTPITTTVPEDVARICDIPEGHLNAFAAALSDTYERNNRAGATIDMVLQKIYYTVASLALRATTTPAPTATAAPTTDAPATYAAA
ncbi:hypothetical protein SEUCBS139899_010908, partial [Sporothrix eucalyptigena]